MPAIKTQIDGVDIEKSRDEFVRFSSGQTAITIDTNVNPVHRIEHHGLSIGFDRVYMKYNTAIFHHDGDYRGKLSLDSIDDKLVNHVLETIDEHTH